MMQKLLESPRINLKPVKENGLTLHEMTMEFNHGRLSENYVDLYTLGELELLEYELIDFLFTVSKYRKEQELING
jgi:hypothetical protein